MDHCYHFTGQASAHGFGGSEQKQCCWCGKIVNIAWEIQSHEIEGHGPYAREKSRVYGELKIEVCEDR